MAPVRDGAEKKERDEPRRAEEAESDIKNLSLLSSSSFSSIERPGVETGCLEKGQFPGLVVDSESRIKSLVICGPGLKSQTLFLTVTMMTNSSGETMKPFSGSRIKCFCNICPNQTCETDGLCFTSVTLNKQNQRVYDYRYVIFIMYLQLS